MFDDGPRGRRVALGGASRGASGRSKQALLEESRRKRGERERAVAPSRAALVLGRHARGSICRAAVATRLCEALSRDVAQQSSTALEPAAALSLVRRLTWLNRIRPSLADAALVEAVARTLLEGQRCGEPFLAARCVCDGGGRWERTAPPLVPPLLRAAASQHASAAGRAALRALFAGWSEAALRALTLAVADALRGWQASGLLAGSDSRHDSAAVLVEAVRLCAAGRGCDWRPDGWCEGGPRLLPPSELQLLPRAMAARLVATLSAQGPPAPPAELLSLRCGHEFCSDCWGGLMTTALQSGAGCIHTRCPQPDCPVLLPAELWQRCLPAGTAAGAWSMLHLRSFVDANALLCWCPSASCSTAAALVTESAADVACSCGTRFCGLCGAEPHWPAACAERREWQQLLHQSPDAQFLLLHTRPCPSCGARTQRDKGCMHITCTNCSAEWCWACGQTGKRGQWAHVFTYFNVHRGASASAVPPLVRLALAQVERHSDVLLALAEPAVGGGSGDEASEASPSSGVADGVVDDVPDRLSWLVTCMLYLRSNLKQAPPAAPGGPSSSRLVFQSVY
ncbi:hypothetical protein EMIHUDRAFT_247186 [Emiliania huxleyi CCMP1516]|uniref:RBR-type E3 ubiquitin transferase n=2 Tax=Emiliania huxleyi TaxID=2903 RepID=A0A0D3IP25_EMIH1|nr:hypothetical protein EMIHUDRAFT_247186 [Emiliania huxleyi CCMP1516]EOD13010.1 hypothetical protein EMIHUDRAFT_247186 [Emiliania huxleyi CCMP1516]|eukprot:XP_005765439.1 hypothetical protein EMIHUDRAFT_247186 [Emiliania huxleyi CCMP1516]